MTLAATTGCDGISQLANTEQSDTTELTAYSNAAVDQGGLYSAFYGLDDGIPFLASFRICRGFGHQDGMPVIFEKEVDTQTVQAGDFLVTLADGQKISVACATPAPAEDLGEFRTILLIGDFGSISNQPATVEVTGNVISLDHQTNFKGSRVEATPLEQGPFLVLAEPVREDQWEIGKQATPLRFGGGDSCPASTRQVIRVVWAGGVTKPGGDEIGELERNAYRVWVQEEDGALKDVVPFAIGDLGDGDNNHELCLDVDSPAVRVEFPGNLMTDPREDLNPETEVSVKRPSMK
jgi:hypothetical protein